MEVDIGRDIAAAIEGHLKALRLLNRADTTVLDVANALTLPPAIVERAFTQFKLSGRVSTKKSKIVFRSTANQTPVIELKKRRRN